MVIDDADPVDADELRAEWVRKAARRDRARKASVPDTLAAEAARLGDRAPAMMHVPSSAVSFAKADEAIEAAESVGLHLDDWQRLAVRALLATNEAGKWAAFEGGSAVPRQNGKGGIIECVLLGGVLAHGERRSVYSAHEFKTSLSALDRLDELLASTPWAARLVRRVSRSNGKEGIIFRSGQTISFRTRTKTGGRGLSVDGRVILDEAMILPETVIGNFIPTMSSFTVQGNPQALYFGSAVDQWIHEYGVPFARLRARGAAADEAVAFLEWCARVPAREDGRPVTPEDVSRAIADDPLAWRQANPSLGIRIAESHVPRERRAMAARTFAVERLGVGDWPDVDEDADTVIDMDAWRELADPGAAIPDPVEIVFDVSPARTWSAVVAAGQREDGRVGLEVVAYGRGTEWLEDRLVALREHRPRGFTCDEKGPAASMIPALRRRGVRVETTSTDEMAQACGDIIDGVAGGLLAHSGDDAFEAAIKAAAKRKIGDRIAWSRAGSEGDITPLVAATLGYWRVRTRRRRGKPAIVVR